MRQLVQPQTWIVILSLSLTLLVACGRAAERQDPNGLPASRPATLPAPTPTVTPTPAGTPITLTLPTPDPGPPRPTATAVITDAQTVALTISGFLFRPAHLQIPVGTTVTWTNRDDIQHTVTSGRPALPAGFFDSGFFYLNQSFSHTFDEPGEYHYFCERHPHMQATITVVPHSG